MKRICHLTSVHQRTDIRIFRKECKSLYSGGYDVNLIVADGLGDSIIEGIKIFDVGNEISRSKRMRKVPPKILKKAIEIDAAIYHFHDPELMPACLKLLKKGKHVIYDVHEDLPRQLLSKPYIFFALKPIIAFLIEQYENYAAKRFSHIITATKFIRNRFSKINSKTIDINNYPLINELISNNETVTKKDQVCYIGGLTEIRGVKQLVDSFKDTETKLLLAGKFENDAFKKKVMSSEGWKNVVELGFIDRNKVKEVLSESLAGMVTFLPLPNHVNAQPNKIYEYMSASLPVIGSDFDLWKQIIEKTNCGICVDPKNPEDIIKAVNKLKENTELIESMGQNGRNAVETNFNWSIEEQKLINLYRDLI